DAAPADGDLFEADSLARAAAGADVVMHLASAIPSGTRQTLRDWQMNDRIRTEGTANLLEAACRVRARFYIQQSEIAVYGSTGENWDDEGSPVLPHRVLDYAGAMERLVRDAGELQEVRDAMLRRARREAPAST